MSQYHYLTQQQSGGGGGVVAGGDGGSTYGYTNSNNLSNLPPSSNNSQFSQSASPSTGSNAPLTIVPTSQMLHDNIRQATEQAIQVSVRPLHRTIFGKDYSFEVCKMSNTGSKTSMYYVCKSEGERQRHIDKIRRMVQPNLDSLRRYENQLQVWIKEIKGLSSKKRYFCEIMLDESIYARTTSKDSQSNAVFWGEQFDFSGLAEGIKMAKVNVFRISESKKEHKKHKQKYLLIGTAFVDLRQVLETGNAGLEQWVKVIPSGQLSGNGKTKDCKDATIRVKLKLIKTLVLPLEKYKHFADLLTQRYLCICRVMEPNILTNQKEDMGKGLVHFLHNVGKVKEYLTALTFDKVLKACEGEEQLLFRDNSICTKSIEGYLKFVGRRYLEYALFQPIRELCIQPDASVWEVDPTRLPPEKQHELQLNQQRLVAITNRAFNSIVDSINAFPAELRDLFATWRQKCEEFNVMHLHSRLMCSSLFLRLLCPAILNPSLFELRYDLPNEKASRALTLVAKAIHNLANGQRFGNKEPYMEFMNQFIDENTPKMNKFLEKISTYDENYRMLAGFDGYIDPGKELARLQQILFEIVLKSPVKDDLVKQLYPLVQIMEDLSMSINDPNHTSKATAILLEWQAAYESQLRQAIGGGEMHESGVDEHNLQQVVPEIDAVLNNSGSEGNGSSIGDQERRNLNSLSFENPAFRGHDNHPQTSTLKDEIFVDIGGQLIAGTHTHHHLHHHTHVVKGVGGVLAGSSEEAMSEGHSPPVLIQPSKSVMRDASTGNEFLPSDMSSITEDDSNTTNSNDNANSLEGKISKPSNSKPGTPLINKSLSDFDNNNTASPKQAKPSKVKTSAKSSKTKSKVSKNNTASSSSLNSETASSSQSHTTSSSDQTNKTPLASSTTHTSVIHNITTLENNHQKPNLSSTINAINAINANSTPQAISTANPSHTNPTHNTSNQNTSGHSSGQNSSQPTKEVLKSPISPNSRTDERTLNWLMTHDNIKANHQNLMQRNESQNSVHSMGQQSVAYSGHSLRSPSEMAREQAGYPPLPAAPDPNQFPVFMPIPIDQNATPAQLRQIIRSMETKLVQMQDLQSKEKQNKEEQMRKVFEKLVSVENDLSRERKRMHTLMDNKEKIIKKQQDKIGQLQETNTRLLAGLQRLKIHYSGQNGRSKKSTTSIRGEDGDDNGTKKVESTKNPEKIEDNVKALNEAELKAQAEAQEKVSRNRVLRSSHQRSANSHYRRPADMEESDDSFAHNSGSPGLGDRSGKTNHNVVHPQSPSKNSKRSIL